MLEKLIKRLGIFVSIYGIWELFAGIGLLLFNSNSLNNATETQKSSESFGVGVILLFLVGIVSIIYSIFLLSGGIKIFQRNKSWHIWAFLICSLSAIQTLFVSSWIVSIIFSENATLEFLISFCAVLGFPINAIVAGFGWWFLLTRNREIMASKGVALQN